MKENPIIASHYRNKRRLKWRDKIQIYRKFLKIRETGLQSPPERNGITVVQLFSGPGPITQAVVVLNQYNLYFWNLHCCMDKWCEEKNLQILMSLEKSMPNSRKNMYLLSYLLYICLHERRKTFSRKGLNLGRFYLNKTPSQVH